MGSLEVIRKKHPVVFEYWFSIMKELEITTSTVSGVWRPKQGSILHRYSLGLDINKLSANVIDKISNKESIIEVLLNNTYSSCTPVKAAELSNAMPAKKVLTTKLFTYIAKDTLSSSRTVCTFNTTHTVSSAAALLGWLGAPWAMSYKSLGIAIHTDAIHSHHVHITLESDLI